ncbi:PEP-CTERM sorting domain-containing protein [Candidatus Nitrospira bockiana]
MRKRGWLVIFVAAVSVIAWAPGNAAQLFINGQGAPLTPVACPTGYTSCFSFPTGVYTDGESDSFIVGSTTTGVLPRLLISDGSTVDVLTLTGLTLRPQVPDPSESLFIEFNHTFNSVFSGSLQTTLKASGSFFPTEGGAGGNSVSMSGNMEIYPILFNVGTINPAISATGSFSQELSPRFSTSICTACNETLNVTFSSIFVGNDTLRLPGSLNALFGPEAEINNFLTNVIGPLEAAETVPEPSSLLLLGSGLIGFLAWRRTHA